MWNRSWITLTESQRAKAELQKHSGAPKQRKSIKTKGLLTLQVETKDAEPEVCTVRRFFHEYKSDEGCLFKQRVLYCCSHSNSQTAPFIRASNSQWFGLLLYSDTFSFLLSFPSGFQKHSELPLNRFGFFGLDELKAARVFCLGDLEAADFERLQNNRKCLPLTEHHALKYEALEFPQVNFFLFLNLNGSQTQAKHKEMEQ